MLSRTITACIVVLASLPAAALADIPLRATRIATGLDKPLFVTAAPGDPDRLFIVQQGTNGTASIRIFNNSTGTLNDSAFLTLSGLSTGGEQGLLGLAFHPDYASNGLFYLNYTVPGGAFGNGTTLIRRFSRLTADQADPNSAQPVLSFDQAQGNHNGGWMGFGPRDGKLYIATGDGGNANDMGTGHTEPGGNAQDLTDKKLGKILRIDVNGDDFASDPNRNYRIPSGNPFDGNNGDREIWHYGLRNPWRDSFDRLTGDLYIGDVGQDRTEEVDFQPDGVGGMNFGWRAYEGSRPRPGNTDPLPANAVPPIHEYDHPNGASRAIIGGYVYRGSENDALAGTYFFADELSNQIWSFKYDGTTKTKFRELTGQIPTDAGALTTIASFGEDNAGRLYIVSLGGSVFRLVPAHPGDANLDRTVDVVDLGMLASSWQTTGSGTWAKGDFNDDGNVDVIDLGILATNWQTGGGRPGLQDALAAYGLPGVVPEPGAAAAIVVAWFALAGRCGRGRGAHGHRGT